MRGVSHERRSQARPNLIEFWLPGNPVAASRPRVSPRRTYYAGPYAKWRQWAPQYCRDNLEGGPLDGPLAVTLRCVFERPKSHYRTGKNSDKLRADAPGYPYPDIDNLGKAVLDALNKVAWHDDKQVVSLGIKKEYGLEPGCQVTVVPNTPVEC